MNKTHYAGFLVVVILTVSVPAVAYAYDRTVDGFLEVMTDLFAEYLRGDVSEAEMVSLFKMMESIGFISFPSFVEDEGDFKVRYESPTAAEWQGWEEWIRDEGSFERETSWLNDNFKLPVDIHIVGKLCGQINAWYDPSKNEIVMCYELFNEVYGNFLGVEDDPVESMLHVIDYVLYHEMGHALIDMYDLPYTGLQEDAADQFAFYIMTEMTNDELGYDTLYSTVIHYYIWNEKYGHLDYLQYHDTHQFGKQRMYNTACFMYGSDPETHHEWRGTEWLPEDRAVHCIQEYEHGIRSWDRLLAPYLHYDPETFELDLTN